MSGLKLRHRYVLTILAVGVLLTVGVVATVYLTGDGGGRARMSLLVGAGLALTMLGGVVASMLIARVDAAMAGVVRSAERIGRGQHDEPVPRSGVRDLERIEVALDRMREALASTTISRDYLGVLLDSMSDAVLVAASDGRVRTANRAAEALLGHHRGGLDGLELASLVAEEHRAAFDVDRLRGTPGETVVSTARGQTIPVSVSASQVSSDDPRFSGWIYVLRDITERKRAERRIRYLARFDALTKMPNRMQFQHLLHQAITRALRQGRTLALLYLDVDNFKEINDTFGHDAGDRVLETLSERLNRVLPEIQVYGLIWAL